MKCFIAPVLLLCAGCSVYTPRTEAPGLVADKEWPFASEGSHGRWWEAYELTGLDRFMEEVLQKNTGLDQAWRRLDQAAAVSRLAGAGSRPQINLSASGSKTEGDSVSTIPGVAIPDEQYRAGATLVYELDLWRRVASTRKAGQSRLQASREDLEATALMLSGTTVDLWLSMLEYRAHVALLEEQIRTSETIMELIVLRFDVGAATALDVYQQREQLAAVRSELPLARSQLESVIYRLNVLRALAPGTPLPETTGVLPVTLPKTLSVPDLEGLIRNRPDLRATLRRIAAAEYDVAVAVADRYPRLSLSFDAAFSSTAASDLFDNETTTLLGDVFAPLLDGGSRRAEVDRRKARSAELLAGYNGQLLEAMREVREAAGHEKHLQDFLGHLRARQKASEAAAYESRKRYTHGLIDYLAVVLAIQSQQVVERRLVSEQAGLLRNRARLYRACGGDWTQTLQENEK